MSPSSLEPPVHGWGDPLDAEQLRTRVHKVLGEFMAEQTARLDEVSPEATPLAEAVASLLDGGKRLRSAFCYWGWRAAGGEDRHAVVRAASSMEMFQAAALIHDDLMDHSDTRRGLPSAHRRFAMLHRGNAWTGDAERFGAAGAILAGDLCLVWCDELFAGSGMSHTELLRGRPTFDLMRTELMGGQYLDMLEQALGGHEEARARRVIRYKSARYTIEQPLLIGASMAGAPPDLLRALSDFGLPLGEAFQLRDDVLGVFGDPAGTGKPAGDDLREGKRTVLVARAMAAASPAQAATVRRHLGDPHLDAEAIADLREIIVDTGALAGVDALIAELVDLARTTLDAAVLADPARGVLESLISAATSRVT